MRIIKSEHTCSRFCNDVYILEGFIIRRTMGKKFYGIVGSLISIYGYLKRTDSRIY